MRLTLVLLVGVALSFACSQEIAENKKVAKTQPEQSQPTTTDKKDAEPPGTKIEALAKKKGITIVLGYAEVGSFQTMYGGYVSVSAREAWDASDPKDRRYGLRVAVKETVPYSRESSSFLDYEEIVSLLEGIDFLGRFDSSATSFRMYQTQYESRGGVRITVFNTRQGKQELSISSGSTKVFANIEQLEKFRGLIVEARAFLHSAMESASAKKGSASAK